MIRNYIGDLTPGLARPGVRVRCIRVPDISPWILPGSKQSFQLPEVRQIYVVRGNILAGSLSGILLKEIVNPDVLCNVLTGEPFFDHLSFNFIG